ncbi:MAG: threonine--tRNA ligase [Deltaproteobacteria bacterium]|nr:threonine--tRNA ligase [Deltaproteobacteria bacterium]
MTAMNIIITFPDGSKKEFASGVTPLAIAESISSKLAEAVVAARVDGQVVDLTRPLSGDVAIELIKPDNPAGFDVLRHSAEHVLATAVIRLFKGAQVTMGPRHHDEEFYYDFDIGRPFTPEDVEKIEAEMRAIVAEDQPFTREELPKEKARELFKQLGQRYKDEILDWIPEPTVTVYRNGDFTDLCRGPHLPSTGRIKAFKLIGSAGAYWRADASREMLQRISGIAFGSEKELKDHLTKLEEAKRRDHRKLGRELELFLVSERFDAHEPEPEEAIEALVTGRVHFASTPAFEWIEPTLAAIRAALPRRTVNFTGVNVSSHRDDSDRIPVLRLECFGPRLDADEQKALRALGDKLLADSRERHGTPVDLRYQHRAFEDIGPGLVLWQPKGGLVRTLMEDFWRREHLKVGYDIVYSPHIAKSDLWKVSGHLGFYRESMYSPMNIDGAEYIAKPMNCPFHVMMFKSRKRSYRDFPMRWAELGTVYRYEMAGVLHGLMRVRGFTQDDAHIFARPDQLDSEVDRLLGFVLHILRSFGFTEFNAYLSTRPAKFVGEIPDWDRAEKALAESAHRLGLKYRLDQGAGTFYGPKIDLKILDAIGREWQCSTVQLDFQLPQRFGLTFVNREGKEERPFMLHRALMGSLERFFGIMIEHYAGAFPPWLSPVQAIALPVTDRHRAHARAIVEQLRAVGLRAQVDPRNEKLGYKIREAQLQKIPFMLVIGDKEVAADGAALRLRSGEDRGLLARAALCDLLVEQCRIPGASADQVKALGIEDYALE